MTIHPFSAALIDWFRENGRSLPWRTTRDPYAIWLSEIILQQTRIEQGRPYWERFMARWPRVELLATASEDEVLREWQGLGYYSRARHLHEAARQIVALGGFPNTLKGLRALKGVGDYTAAAIASFAFDLPAAVVDGNVYRVLARHFGIDTPINSTEGKHVFAALAQELLPTRHASDYNQAIMDFGAVQCMPHGPRCQLCPLAESCVALSTGRTEQLPVKNKTLKTKERRLVYVYIRCRENGCGACQTAIRRRGAGDIWQGLWEPLEVSELLREMLPGRQTEGQPFAEEQVHRMVAERLAADGARLEVVCRQVKHLLTHRVLIADCYLLETNTKPQLPDGFVWVDEAELDRYAKPRLVEILLEKLS